MDENIEPAVATASVHSPVGDTVRAFTEGINDWWPLTGFTVGEANVARIVFEPHAGGRVHEVWHDGEGADWATVDAYEPPGRIVLAWRPRPGNDDEPPTEVEVGFQAVSPTVTKVRVEHRGFEPLGESGRAARDSYASGWPDVLARFAAHATDPLAHRTFAIQTHQLTWQLLEKTDRTAADDERMVNAAHASAYHWNIVGEPENAARGNWMLARVYAVLGRGEPAVHHAKLVLALCDEHDLRDFDLAYAHEGMARASAAAGDVEEAVRSHALAAVAAEGVAEPEDREIFDADLVSEPWFGALDAPS